MASLTAATAVDCVDRRGSARALSSSGSQPVEPQRVLRVALRARRLLVHFHEHAVDAGGDAGRGHRLDELRLAGGDAVAGAGQLQAVRHVVDDRIAERAQHRERAHVDDQVVVAEAEAALGDDDAAGCRPP